MAFNANMKQKGSRIRAFATADHEEEDFQTALVKQHDTESQKRADSVEGSAQPSRDDIADEVRMPLPLPGRVTASHTRELSAASHRQRQSPIRGRHASPRPASNIENNREESTYGGLFAGSQLGDDFMRSNLTSPTTELEDENALPQDWRNGFARNNHSGWNYKSRQRPQPAQQIVLGQDGFLEVVEKGTKHSVSQLRDGFTADSSRRPKEEILNYTDTHNRSSSNGRPSQLAVRPERRRLIKPENERVLHVSRTHSPTSKRGREAQAAAHALSNKPYGADDEESNLGFSDEDDVRITPKAHRTKLLTHNNGDSSQAPPLPHGLREDSRGGKRVRPDSDYPDDALGAMTFMQLRDEPFDFDPTKAAAGKLVDDTTQSLSTKLEQRKNLPVDEQRHFFASMSINDWESSGDWFIDQFTDLMHKMRDARKAKRKQIQEFEDEAERREEAVRLRSEMIDRKLSKMRQDGLKVVSDGNA